MSLETQLSGNPSVAVSSNARLVALQCLRAIARGGFTDVVLHRHLHETSLSALDRGLVTELVYGSVRRQRTLDALLDQFGKKSAQQQPLDLRLILHLGLYQLRYLHHIPPHAVVDTAVELAKQAKLGRLSGVVNGILRQYIRSSQATTPHSSDQADLFPQGSGATISTASSDPLYLPDHPILRLGILHSFPDWMISLWQTALGETETAELCQWLNQTPTIDLRVNRLRTTMDAVITAFEVAGIGIQPLAGVPDALRLTEHVGAIQALPGYDQGWWTVQDASAQLVSYLLDPQPHEVVIDACAAPGGKTTHLAELMGDQGTIWACDRTSSRLRKVTTNLKRLQLNTIQVQVGDSRDLPQFVQLADRVLVDAPCSGLGTLHRHADARWRQTPETIDTLVPLQLELLTQAATWVKPGGCLVYATCTLHPAENEGVMTQFLDAHPHWRIDPPQPPSPVAPLADPAGWIKLWPHRHQMDGFFMVRLVQG